MARHAAMQHRFASLVGATAGRGWCSANDFDGSEDGALSVRKTFSRTVDNTIRALAQRIEELVSAIVDVVAREVRDGSAGIRSHGYVVEG